MENYALGLAGILVSIFLFWLGYRQTIGAKKERVRSANAELEHVLVRRVVLESFLPGEQDLSRLLEGKALEHGVRPEDLMSESQLLAGLFTRIVETDFISQKQRQAVVERLMPLITKIERAPEEEPEPIRDSSRLRQSSIITVLLASTALLSATISLFSASSTSDTMPREAILGALAAAGVTLAATGTIVIVRRYRDTQPEPSKAEAYRQYVGFEQEVLDAAKAAGGEVTLPASPKAPYDFQVAKGERKYLVEVKAWPRHISLSLVKAVASRLSRVVRARRSTMGLIVTREKPLLPSELHVAPRIRIVTVAEFRSLLARDSAAK